MSQTAGFIAETTAEVYRPFALVQMETNSTTVRMHSGIGPLSWNSQTWTGTGDLGMIGIVSAGTELAASQVELTLSGLNSTNKAELIDELTRGGDVYIYYGFYDSSGAVVADPWLGFFGNIDTVDITETIESTSVSVMVLDGVGARLRRTQRRRTDADQQDIFSGDEIYEFVASGKTIHWGAPGVGPSTTGINTRGNTGGGGTFVREDGLRL